MCALPISLDGRGTQALRPPARSDYPQSRWPTLLSLGQRHSPKSAHGPKMVPRNLKGLWSEKGNRRSPVRTRSTPPRPGIAFRPGDRELWASETSRNGPDSILITKISEVGMPGESSRIGLNGHPLPTGIAFSPDGKLAYVAFSRSNTLAIKN